MQRKIIIWGAGGNGVKLLFRLKKEHKNVEYFIDSNLEGVVHGITILHDISSIENINEYYIIVATFYNPFLEIKNILIQNRLIEFEDFIWVDLYEKQIVVINANNCHGEALQSYLEKSKQFKHKYGIYPIKSIQWNEKGYIEDNVMSHADIYITQDIRVNNPFSYKLSYDYTTKQVRRDCKIICIPNMVSNGKGFFPTQTNEVFRIKLYNGTWGLFYRDYLIDEAVKANETGSLEDVIKYIQTYEFDETQIRRGFDEMMQKIRAREIMWDVKVADYIEKNYRMLPMMVDASHPSDTLMLEICRQVANILDITDLGDLDMRFHMGVESFIWPGIRKILGMEYNIEYVRIRDWNNLDNENVYNLKDFLQLYIWCFHDKFLE